MPATFTRPDEAGLATDAELAAAVAALGLNVKSYGAVVNDSSAGAKTANQTAFNAAIAAANTALTLVVVSAGTYYFPAGVTLTTLTGAVGIVAPSGTAILEFNVDGNCVVSKGSFKRFENLYINNQSTTHTAIDAVLRIKNCISGHFKHLYVNTNGANSSCIMLEHEYTGSADDAYLIAHVGCWYNVFDGVVTGYLTVGADTGYGLDFRVDSSAVAVVNPPGQAAGTYTGSVGYNTVNQISVEGHARGINLDRAVSNVFTGGQLLGNAAQVYGRNSSSGNSFVGIKHNQWATSVFDMDSSCEATVVLAPVLFNSTSPPWSIGALGTNSTLLIAPSGVAEYGLSGLWHVVAATGEPAFGTDWSSGGGGTAAAPAFYRDGNGRVFLRGIATKSTAFSGDDTIFTLPAGYRPAYDADIPVIVYNGTARILGTIRVDTGGLVRLFTAGAGGSLVWLDSINFRVN